jgi:hypothetical protein
MLRRKSVANILLTDLSLSESTHSNPLQDCTIQEMLSVVGGGKGGHGHGYGGGGSEGPGIYRSSYGPGNSGEEYFYDDNNDPSDGFYEYRRHGSKSSTFYVG